MDRPQSQGCIWTESNLKHAGIDIATFGILRDQLAMTHGPAPPAGLLMAAGMLSSTTAQLVAYPLGLVRTRLQVCCGKSSRSCRVVAGSQHMSSCTCSRCSALSLTRLTPCREHAACVILLVLQPVSRRQADE